MILALHGVAGGWDEILIAVGAFAVLWIAVKLAGRKPADGDEDADEPLEGVESVEASGTRDGSPERAAPTKPPATKLR